MAGGVRYNSTTTTPEYCNGSAWLPFKVTGIPVGAGAFVVSTLAPNACFQVWISSTTHSGTTATTTTNSQHGLSVGNAITVTDAVPALYNGTFTIATVPTSTTFTYTLTGTPASNATTHGSYCGTTTGLAAANNFCLRDLTTNTGWFGYSSAALPPRLVMSCFVQGKILLCCFSCLFVRAVARPPLL